MNKSSLGFLAAIAQAIVSFCLTFIKSMNVVSDTVDMASASVTVAKKKQAIDLEIDMVNYGTKAINKATLDLAKQEESMDEYASKDEARKERMQKIKASLNDRVNKKLAELEQVAE